MIERTLSAALASCVLLASASIAGAQGTLNPPPARLALVDDLGNAVGLVDYEAVQGFSGWVPRVWISVTPATGPGDPQARWLSVQGRDAQGAYPDFVRGLVYRYWTNPDCTGEWTIPDGVAPIDVNEPRLVLLDGSDIGYRYTRQTTASTTYHSYDQLGTAGPCTVPGSPHTSTTRLQLEPLVDLTGVWQAPYWMVPDGTLGVASTVATVSELATAVLVFAFVGTYWFSMWRKRQSGAGAS